MHAIIHLHRAEMELGFSGTLGYWRGGARGCFTVWTVAMHWACWVLDVEVVFRRFGKDNTRPTRV